MYINHYTPYSYTAIGDISGFTYGSFNEINSDFVPHDKEKKRIILSDNKKQFIFKLEPFIYLDKDISSSAEANDKNKIEIFIKKSSD